MIKGNYINFKIEFIHFLKKIYLIRTALHLAAREN